jgi:hypothetical protein
MQDEFFAIRKPGAHLEENVVTDDFVIALGSTCRTTRSSPRSTTP